MTVDRRTFAAGAAAWLGAGALGAGLTGSAAQAQAQGQAQGQAGAAPPAGPPATATPAGPAPATAAPAPGRFVRLPHSPVMKFRRGIAIGNALEASYEGEWGYTIQRRHLEAIKRAGFDHVRLPVKFSGHLESAPPFTIDPKFMLRLDEILRWMVEVDLICIIDVHHFDNISERPDIHEPRLVAIWRQVASRYAHLPNSIVFEVINEPRGLLIGERLRRMYRNVLAEIRPQNPTRPVILSGDRWGNSIGLPALLGMDDPNIIATFHYYAPGNFTHQGAWWDKNQSPKMGVKWGTPADVQKVKADIALAAQRAQPLRMPVYLGEFGVINTIPDTERAPWIRTVRKAAEAHGMAWCIWQFVVSGHMYDLKTDTWSAPIYQALFDRPPPRPALASR